MSRTKRHGNRWIELDTTTILDLHFNKLMSVKEIAHTLGVARGTIVTRILEAGRNPRSQAEANRLRMSKLTDLQKRRLTKEANRARRGRRASRKELITKAQSRVGKFASTYERQIHWWLKMAGFDATPNYAIDTINIDLALPDIQFAIEVDGGNWHSSPRKAEQDRRKAAILAQHGWLLARIQIVKGRERRTRRQFDQLVSHIEALSRHPPPGSQ